MAISTVLEYRSIDDLYLDPVNPRLGRHLMGSDVTQETILQEMISWTLDELALSYLESGGFWTNEALLVVEEELYGESRLIVVEGNRRLAALKYLKDAYDGNPYSRKWKTICENTELPPEELFAKVPFLRVDSRKDVQAFLGFRHVTGIKPWDADEKAGFIAKLIDEHGMTYEQVMRKIGSNAPTVRKHYIAYRTLLQIEETVDDFVPKLADNRFAILYMSLATEGARSFLDVNIMADHESARTPIPPDHLENLAKFSKWLFGTKDDPIPSPLVTDTRQVSSFGKILENEAAVEYLENTKSPKFDVALRIAGGDEAEIIKFIQEASYNLEQALSRVHSFKDSIELQGEVHRLGEDALQLLGIFPEIFEELQKKGD